MGQIEEKFRLERKRNELWTVVSENADDIYELLYDEKMICRSIDIYKDGGLIHLCMQVSSIELEFLLDQLKKEEPPTFFNSIKDLKAALFSTSSLKRDGSDITKNQVCIDKIRFSFWRALLPFKEKIEEISLNFNDTYLAEGDLENNCMIMGICCDTILQELTLRRREIELLKEMGYE